MAIVEQTISESILTFLNSTSQQENVEVAKKKFADDLAGIIANAIKSATIVVPAGIPVTTTGSPSAQTGATTAPATCTIS